MQHHREAPKHLFVFHILTQAIRHETPLHATEPMAQTNPVRNAPGK
jgi:hypothetical protein